ncbi:MAG: GNAT family N-acetyltransferase [Gemmatimonas sp.]|nr:GNAT family N-acetyltransferase [Gemmatimonas sp.]
MGTITAAFTPKLGEATTLRDKAGVPFVVRAYDPRFRDELQRFYEEFEPKRAAQGLPPSHPERIRDWLDDVLGKGINLIALRHDELAGHALVMPTSRDGIGEYAIFLREDLRGRGVGSEFGRVVVAAARANDLRGLWLTVEPGKRAAIRTYEKAGFRFIPQTVLSVEAEMEIDFTDVEGKDE